MRKVIKADLRRILRKPFMYVWFGFIFLVFTLFSGLSDYTNEMLEAEHTAMKALVPFFISVPVFLSVYGDEMKSGAMQCIIGRGISRAKVILAKYLECLILSMLYVIFIEGVMYARNIVLDAGASRAQTIDLFIFILFLFVKTAGYFAFASFFVFLSWSTAPGMVTLLSCTSLVGMVLMLLQEQFRFPVYDLYLDGLIDRAYAQITAGSPAVMLIPAIGVFICGVLWVTILIFKKKEIEF